MNSLKIYPKYEMEPPGKTLNDAVPGFKETFHRSQVLRALHRRDYLHNAHKLQIISEKETWMIVSGSLVAAWITFELIKSLL